MGQGAHFTGKIGPGGAQAKGGPKFYDTGRVWCAVKAQKKVFRGQGELIFGKARNTQSVQLTGRSKLHWRHLNLSSKQQVTLNRKFSSGKVLNSRFFVYIHI